MANEVKNEILNLEHTYDIILTTTGKVNLKDDGSEDKSVLFGLRSHNALFSTQREYDFTGNFKGGKS